MTNNIICNDFDSIRETAAYCMANLSMLPQNLEIPEDINNLVEDINEKIAEVQKLVYQFTTKESLKFNMSTMLSMITEDAKGVLLKEGCKQIPLKELRITKDGVALTIGDQSVNIYNSELRDILSGEYCTHYWTVKDHHYITHLRIIKNEN